MSFRAVFMEDAERDLGDIGEYLSQYYTSTVRNFFVKLKKRMPLLVRREESVNA